MLKISPFVVCVGIGLASVGCAPEAKVPQCGEKGCPAGGEITSAAEAKTGVDVGGGGSLLTQSANATYKVYDEGNCKYACKFPKCPDGTTPDITLDHFKCAPAGGTSSSSSGGPASSGSGK